MSRSGTSHEGNHNYDGPRVFGYTQWRKGWVKVSSELTQGRRALGTFIRDVVSSIGDAGSTRPGGNATSSTRRLYAILLTNLKILVVVGLVFNWPPVRLRHV